MLITNFRKLARNFLRRKALLIAEAGYEAIGINKSVSQRIKNKNGILEISLTTARVNKEKTLKIDLNKFSRIFVVGIGKGSALACNTLAKILGPRLSSGIVLDIQKPKQQTINYKLQFFVGTHPLPSNQNISATQKIIELVKNFKKDDLLINFICGGGSALACASENELKSSILAIESLTKAGANILELNTVRKHISEIKGGGLAKIAYPATLISLIVSDVISNDLSMVASGLTVFDKTTKTDAKNILKNYNLESNNFNLIETPKDKKYFKKARNILFISNQEAVLAMDKKAKKLGFTSKVYSLTLEGEAKNSLLPMIKKVKIGEVLLAAGETTVKLKGKSVGKGGRNTEAVLGIIAQNSKLETKNLVVIAFSSDCRDNTEAAGAIADYSTIEKAKKLNLEPQKFLDEHNSFHFFKKTGDLIFVKPKSFNVADLMIILKK